MFPKISALKETSGNTEFKGHLNAGRNVNLKKIGLMLRRHEKKEEI